MATFPRRGFDEVELVAKEQEILACVRALVQSDVKRQPRLHYLEELITLGRELQRLEDALRVKDLAQRSCNHHYATKEADEGCTHCGKPQG